MCLHGAVACLSAGKSSLRYAGSVVVPVERSEGGADYRDAFRDSNSRGASFEADVPMTLAALLDHMEQRSSDVLSGSADRGCAMNLRLCASNHGSTRPPDAGQLILVQLPCPAQAKGLRVPKLHLTWAAALDSLLVPPGGGALKGLR